MHEAALAKVAGSKPLLHAATDETSEKMAGLAKEHGCPLAVKAPTLEALAELTEKISGSGAEDLVLSFDGWSLAEALRGLTQARAAALKKNFRPLGYPTVAFATGSTPHAKVASASATPKQTGLERRALATQPHARSAVAPTTA